ncbi:MAG: hypothetical protein Hyperionvirus4_107 [Hyperionvirus sp.]|uniref:Uncharacterized protein n=1 Tax=Hyperionvirus sp. TaxID=2487770 RepID=A0A3G5A7X9_9VIRU|nr:MAG: hypothetical protein Hyperionvirus4_107 [Hyperionvirus sp.]
MEFSIEDAFYAGLKVECLGALPIFTETDSDLSFHMVPRYFESIAQTLRWQATNITSEDFLCNQLCFFVELGDSIVFCLDASYSGIPMGTFPYCVTASLCDTQKTIMLLGPSSIAETVMEQEFISHGFLMWESECHMEIFGGSFKKKYGTFRQFYPQISVRLHRLDGPLRCEHNTKKGMKYLKLLHASYVDRLSKVFDELPRVLIDMISSYVLGEFLLESLYW